MFRMMKLVPAAALCLASAAYAQDNNAFQDAFAAPPGQESVDIYTAGDAAAVLAARLIALKTVLELTPDQEKLWQSVEDSIRLIAANSAKRNDERQAATPPNDFLDVLDRMADSEIVRGQELKSFVVAARPLVASLSEEQKRRAPAFLGIFDNPDAPQPISQLWLFEDEQG
jgi:hypothetical protein